MSETDSHGDGDTPPDAEASARSSRREFLIGAGTASVAAAGAAYLTRTLQGTRLPAPKPSPITRGGRCPPATRHPQADTGGLGGPAQTPVNGAACAPPRERLQPGHAAL